jgi:glutathione S-transferase
MSSSNISTSSPAAQLIPATARALAGEDRSFADQGMLDSMLLCRYEKAWCGRRACSGRPGATTTGTGVWSGMARFEGRDDVLNGPFDIAPDRARLRAGYADFRFADCGWRKAYPKLDRFHQKMLERPSVKVSAPPAA